MDFKQSRRLKKKEWVEDYYLQLVAYSEAHNKLYDTQINSGRIFICTQNNEFQTFDIDNYDPEECYEWQYSQIKGGYETD